MSVKPVFVFVFPDCIGGVSSFNRNLINYNSYGKDCSIRVILLQDLDNRRDRFTDELKAAELIRFAYSGSENQYFVSKRLHALFGAEKGCIITDNAQTLNTIGLFGSAKRVIYLVHDYFYIDWALRYARSIDAAIAHSSFFRDILLAAAISEYQSKAFYIPYGVEAPAVHWQKERSEGPLKLVFLGRLVEEKGVLLLKEIDRLLQERRVSVIWTLIGKGPLADTLTKQWAGIPYVRFVQAADTREIFTCLEEQDVLVFPSQFEGTPVSIMESMSRGVVPVVSDLPGGTRDMVTEEIGSLCNVSDAPAYANAIVHLKENPELLRQKQEACIRKGREVYDIAKAADHYFSFLTAQTALPVKPDPSGIAFLSRMDKKKWPNWLVTRLRKLRK